MEFDTVPENKDHNENFKKACAIAEDRNQVIAKLFGVEPREPKALLFHSAGALAGKIHSQEREFKGYADGSEELLLVHPDAVDGLFTDLWKEMSVITDFVLVKYYLCKIYYPNREDFKMYYRYISDQLAAVVSGKFQETIAKFEYKFYVRGKKLKKETAVGLLLFYMREHSGTEFIFKNLDKIMEDKDIEKSVSEIYNKSIDELLLPEKEKTIQEERKKQELEKEKRRAAFNANQKNYSTNNAQRPHNTQQRKFVTRDKFKSKNSQQNKDTTNNNNKNKPSQKEFSKKPNRNHSQKKPFEKKETNRTTH